ncbi:MAG TPA: tripartite tricarboxylate transporter substrate binding protein [Roseomonas sp.]
MQRFTRRGSLILAATLARPALAQGRFPERPVRVIVPYSAGGVGDTIARILQPKMAEHLSQAVVVENRTGASGAIAAVAVAQSPPDGYTLMLEGATFTTLPLVSRNLPIDYEAAFAPVAQATAQPYFIAVRRDFPAEDIRGFIAEANRRPGEVTFGTPGVAHIAHFMGELLQIMAHIRLEHVPFRGGADASREVGAGRIDAAIISHSSLQPVLQSGLARLIAVTSAERRPIAPEVPALAEILPGYELTTWTGLFAPAATPLPVRQRITAALHHAVHDAQTSERLVGSGNDPVVASTEQFAELIRSNRAIARRIVANAPSLRG